MKCIYEHDEEEDFVEIQLTEKELKQLMRDDMLNVAMPAMLHTRRSTNICVRREICH